MMRIGIMGLVTLMAVFSGRTQAAAKEKNVYLLSHYELTELSVEKRVAYIKALRTMMLDLEKQQTKMGVGYPSEATALYKLWMATWIDTAEAQTVVEAGKPCIFAGGISSYASSKRLTCINNRRCGGKSGMIECNPLLFGENLCTAARDGATARCLRNMTINEDELAAQLATGEKRTKWDQFKNEFDAFCTGVLKDAKDINYRSCQIMYKQVHTIQKHIDKNPAQDKVAASSAEMTAITPKVIQGACGKAGSGNCLKCPAPYFIDQPRDITAADLGTDKYSQLMKILAQNCSVKSVVDNDTVATQVAAKNLGELVKKFGVCSENDYPGAGQFTKTTVNGEEEFDAEQKKLITALLSNEAEAQKELAEGRNSEYSKAMQNYFGFSVREAREAFCTGVSVPQVVDILRQNPDFAFMHGIQLTKSEVADLVNSDKPITSVPRGLQMMEWNNIDGPPTMALNKFKKQVLRRQKLADCLAKNYKEPARRKKMVAVEVPRQCHLLSYAVTKEQFPVVLKNVITEHGATCVEAAEGGVSGRCTSCNAEGCICNAQVEGPANLSVLKCAAPPPGSRPQTNTPATAVK